tara:strand:+ start:1093 stop:1332 length:240 start_codon:yes stop_codon:yes gene_type:complete
LSYLIRNDLTTIKVIYFLPDYNSILQEFVFQQYDILPEYPKLKKFIRFWRKNIEAEIHRVDFSSMFSEYKFVETVLTIN